MENIHERVLHLKDVALGSSKAVQVNSTLAPASYDCAVDSLLALYTECKQATSLAKDKNVGRFLAKCEKMNVHQFTIDNTIHVCEKASMKFSFQVTEVGLNIQFLFPGGFPLHALECIKLEGTCTCICRWRGSESPQGTKAHC